MAGEFWGSWEAAAPGNPHCLTALATVIRPTGGRIRMRETDVHSLRGADLAEYRGRKSAICSRALSCWTISPDGKTFCCRCRCTVSRQRKAGSVCSHFRTIWKLRMCWISSRRRCPAATAAHCRSEGTDPPAGYCPGGRAYGRPGFRQCKVADGKAVRTEPGTQYHHPHGHP